MSISMPEGVFTFNAALIVDAQGEEPLPGVTVRLRETPDGDDLPIYDGSGVELAGLVTSSRGVLPPHMTTTAQPYVVAGDNVVLQETAVELANALDQALDASESAAFARAAAEAAADSAAEAVETIDGIVIDASATAVAGAVSGDTVARDAVDARVPAVLEWEVAERTPLGLMTHDAVQAAATAAKTSGKRLYAAGAYTTSQTLVIESACDLSGLAITYTGSGIAVQGGATGALLMHEHMSLPSVTHGGKTVNGWAEVAGTVGYRLLNLNSCQILAPYAFNFETNMVVEGNAQGTVHNQITLGHLRNGKVNLSLSRSGGGWCNQNQFYGGRLSHLSAEGLNVPGTAHIRTEDGATNPINSNQFDGTSIEYGTAEWHLDVGGSNQLFDNLRFEVVGGARVRWRTDSVGNVIREGYQSQAILQTWEAGAGRNQIRAYNFWSHPSDRTMMFGNTGSAGNPTFTVMDPTGISSGADPATAYRWAWSAHELRGKRAAEAHDRIRLDGNNGRLYFGTGAAAPTAFLGMAGPALRIDGVGTSATAGATSEYLMVYVGGAIKLIELRDLP